MATSSVDRLSTSHFQHWIGESRELIWSKIWQRYMDNSNHLPVISHSFVIGQTHERDEKRRIDCIEFCLPKNGLYLSLFLSCLITGLVFLSIKFKGDKLIHSSFLFSLLHYWPNLLVINIRSYWYTWKPKCRSKAIQVIENKDC